MPAELAALVVGPANIIVTAVIPTSGGLLLRMYEAAGREARPEISGDRVRLRELTGLDGAPVETLGPFRIGLAHCVAM